MDAVKIINNANLRLDVGDLTLKQYEGLIAPLRDVEAVVRCKDCIRFHPDDDVWGRCTVAANRMRKKDFCSYGVKDGDHHEEP